MNIGFFVGGVGEIGEIEKIGEERTEEERKKILFFPSLKKSGLKSREGL